MEFRNHRIFKIESIRTPREKVVLAKIFKEMRKLLFVVVALFLLLACAKNNRIEDSVDITVSSWDHIFNDRNGEDYVRLWVNDTLLFSDTFHVNYVDSIRETWYEINMKVATIHKFNRDSVKIRVRLVSLDSILFAGHHAVDTTFRYRIDNIPYMNIDYFRQLSYFRTWNPVTDPQFYQLE